MQINEKLFESIKLFFNKAIKEYNSKYKAENDIKYFWPDSYFNRQYEPFTQTATFATSSIKIDKLNTITKDQIEAYNKWDDFSLKRINFENDWYKKQARSNHDC